MTIANSQLIRTLYEGRPADKLAVAESLHGESAPCSGICRH